jgi:two-component system LytT family sensor kinase
LVLQPIVENAVKHGISKQRRGGEVTVTARLDRDGPAPRLVLVVSDTGAGATVDALEIGRATGVGLRNVERRLACQYGDAASLAIQSTPNAGTVVEIRLPVNRTTSIHADVQGVAR